MEKKYDFFLAGVIQGSIREQEVHGQEYREQLKQIIARRTPGRTVFCPIEEHRSSVLYDDAEARRVFFAHLDVVRQCRALVAYLPVASMGTAIEMETCRRADIPIITISPMGLNWIIRLYSAAVLPDLEAFEAWLTEDNLRALGL
jgi:hypothetical protein